MRTPSPTQGGLAGQLSSLSHFDLAPGQALVVSVGKSDAAYQGFEAADAFAQSLPYATHQSSLNATQAQLSSDGRYWFVVSSTDPGVPNWIDTEGYTQGFLFLRWQELTGTLPPVDDPTSQVVALSALRSALPAGTPRITPAQRKASLTGTRQGRSAPSPHGEQSISGRPHRLPAPDRGRRRPGPTAGDLRRLHPRIPPVGETALSGRTPAALPAWISIHSAPSSPAVQA